MPKVFPIQQPDHKRLVVHLVNYDIDDAKDAIRDKTDVAVDVPWPDFLNGKVVANLHSGDAETQSIEVTASSGRRRFSIPRLGIWATAIVNGE